jgi:hypothetical protein
MLCQVLRREATCDLTPSCTGCKGCLFLTLSLWSPRTGHVDCGRDPPMADKSGVYSPQAGLLPHGLGVQNSFFQPHRGLSIPEIPLSFLQNWHTPCKCPNSFHGREGQSTQTDTLNTSFLPTEPSPESRVRTINPQHAGRTMRHGFGSFQTFGIPNKYGVTAKRSQADAVI